jgi:hypothetical protein
MLELCYAVAEQQEEDLTTTHHTQLAQGMLDSMVLQDAIDIPDTLGRMVNESQGIDIGRWRRGFTINDKFIYSDGF